MINFSRRNFTKSGLTNTAALPLTAHPISFPQVLTAQEMVFQVYPHAWMPEKLWLYAADEFDDPFESGIALKSEGIVVPSELGERLFSLHVRWFVEGFGYVVLTADNGSEYYSLKCFTRNPILNLNFELFKSRIMRNRRVQTRYEKEGVSFSHEIRYLSSIAEQFYADAVKTNSVKQADYADRGLMYALWAGEKIELERAQYHIESNRRTDLVHFGCETRQYIWAKSEEFTRQFARLFNFATVTHYIWDTWYEVFEPSEGRYNWGVKDNIVNWLGENDITIQGRPLFWFHHSVTPTWLKGKSFDELKKYVVDHTRNVVGHYGDRVMQWEVINEYHDWANIHEHSAKQTIEITKLACDTVKEMNPEIVTIINNCCPFAEYAATGRWNENQKADRPQRSPRKFISELLDAGVDFDVLGIQIYFPNRDLSEIMRMVERFEAYGKSIYITEIGATSGPSKAAIMSGKMDMPTDPYAWHRPWDEELQAEWLEQVYTLYYSRPSIKAINWYDFADFRTFIPNGGLVTEACQPKRSYQRLHKLLDSWNRLPNT